MTVTVNYNVDSQRLKALTSVEVNEQLKDLDTLTFFKVKMGVSSLPSNIKELLLVKMYGNSYLDQATNELYKLVSGRLKLKHVTKRDSIGRYDSYYVYSITPLKTIINLSRED